MLYEYVLSPIGLWYSPIPSPEYFHKIVWGSGGWPGLYVSLYSVTESTDMINGIGWCTFDNVFKLVPMKYCTTS